MNRSVLGDPSAAMNESPFALPRARRRIGAVERGGRESAARLLTMVAVGFLLTSPVIAWLVVSP